MAYGSRNNRKKILDSIVEGADGSSIIEGIESAIQSEDNRSRGRGAASAAKSLEDTYQNVSSMKRSLGAKQQATNEAITERRSSDSKSSIAKDWMTILTGQAEADKPDNDVKFSEQLASRMASPQTVDDKFLVTGKPPPKIDSSSAPYVPSDNPDDMPITYSGDQEAGASGRTAAIDAALEEAVGKEEPAGLMSRPTKDNVDAPEAYTAEVEKITKAQTALTDLGFKPNGIDGNLGGGTRRAIRKFQKANGLSVTGQLDLDTVEKINSGNAVEYPDPPKPNAVVEDILPADFDIFTVEIAKIESSDRYDIMGGANNHYVGRYQMGKDALKDVGRGYNDKLNKALLNNPKEQDKLFKAYTTKNHKHLTKNSQAYRDMSPQEKLGILGYAHNQGATAAEEYLYTGVSGKDANGTKGTKYKDALAKAFEGILSMSKRPRARPTGLGS
jgi:peptidoglycan hydrolase-like protein with peptidoglycan-binding domain